MEQERRLSTLVKDNIDLFGGEQGGTSPRGPPTLDQLFGKANRKNKRCESRRDTRGYEQSVDGRKRPRYAESEDEQQWFPSSYGEKVGLGDENEVLGVIL